MSVAFGPLDTTPRYRREPGNVMRVDEASLQAVRLGADFTFEGQRHLAKVVDVLAGDTVRVVFRQGEQIVQYRARMIGYDSPRLALNRILSRAEDKDKDEDEEKEKERAKEVKAAKAAKKALAEKIGTGLVFIECGPFDMYGRLLVTIFARDDEDASENGENINVWMISKGHGTPHDEN